MLHPFPDRALARHRQSALHHQHRQTFWLVRTPHPTQTKPQPSVCYAPAQTEPWASGALIPAQTEASAGEHPAPCTPHRHRHRHSPVCATPQPRQNLWSVCGLCVLCTQHRPSCHPGQSCWCDLVCSARGHRTTLPSVLPEGPRVPSSLSGWVCTAKCMPEASQRVVRQRNCVPALANPEKRINEGPEPCEKGVQFRAEAIKV